MGSEERVMPSYVRKQLSLLASLEVYYLQLNYIIGCCWHCLVRVQTLSVEYKVHVYMRVYIHIGTRDTYVKIQAV